MKMISLLETHITWMTYEHTLQEEIICIYDFKKYGLYLSLLKKSLLYNTRIDFIKTITKISSFY